MKLPFAMSFLSDEDLRKAIERLAAVVAKNGPQFENMTRHRQEGNPKFEFLFEGAPFHDYYCYARKMEIDNCK